MWEMRKEQKGGRRWKVGGRSRREEGWAERRRLQEIKSLREGKEREKLKMVSNTGRLEKTPKISSSQEM